MGGQVGAVGLENDPTRGRSLAGAAPTASGCMSRPRRNRAGTRDRRPAGDRLVAGEAVHDAANLSPSLLLDDPQHIVVGGAGVDDEGQPASRGRRRRGGERSPAGCRGGRSCGSSRVPSRRSRRPWVADVARRADRDRPCRHVPVSCGWIPTVTKIRGSDSPSSRTRGQSAASMLTSTRHRPPEPRCARSLRRGPCRTPARGRARGCRSRRHSSEMPHPPHRPPSAS